jgi:hypothetical protein
MRIPASTSIGFKSESNWLCFESESATFSKATIDGCWFPFIQRVHVASLKPEVSTLSLKRIDKNKSTRFLENCNVSKVYISLYFFLLAHTASISHNRGKAQGQALKTVKPPGANGKPLMLDIDTFVRGVDSTDHISQGVTKPK